MEYENIFFSLQANNYDKHGVGHRAKGLRLVKSLFSIEIRNNKNTKASLLSNPAHAAAVCVVQGALRSRAH